MKPREFAYAKAASLAQVFDLLAAHGEESRILAGGQSLIPSLNFRLSAPSVLIDINGIDALRGISVAGDHLRVGALTRHYEIARSGDIARHVPLMHQAVGFIAHAAIRNRGTIGGSLALADPAAEWPACILALDARIEIAGPDGSRKVAAGDFFHGLFETAVQPGEVLTAVEIPLLKPGYRSHFHELSRRRGDFAMVGLALHGRVEAGRLSDMRVVFLGLDTAPVLCVNTARALEEQFPTAEVLTAARTALADEVSPRGDPEASPETKLHLAGVLLQRGLTRLIEENA